MEPVFHVVYAVHITVMRKTI